MARSNYFQDMKNRYQGNENWINMISAQDIQKSAVKRIFKEMVNGSYDYGKEGQYFLDSRFLENLIVAAGAKLEYYTLLSNAVNLFKEYQPGFPNLGAHITHIQNLWYIYNTIYNKLDAARITYNTSPLVDISRATYNFRNDINNE
jgi:hypothetical protein